MNFGKDVSTLKFFTICGLQEGYEPFAVNMNRDVTMWLSKRLPQFIPVPPGYEHIEVCSHAVFYTRIFSSRLDFSAALLFFSTLVQFFTYFWIMSVKSWNLCYTRSGLGLIDDLIYMIHYKCTGWVYFK